jgi:hypothetical protein
MRGVQIAGATLADPPTIEARLRRQEAPTGLEAQPLTELVAFVEEMARNIRADALPKWLERDIPSSTAATSSTSSPPAGTSA